MTSLTASPDPDLLAAVFDLLTKRRADHDGLFVLGICGSQGSGKSTLARALQAKLGVQGIASAVLSLDDLYLGKAARAALAAEVHPLFATRGVPGTHDVMLGLEVVEALRRGDAVRLPRFSKAEDDRAELKDWPLAPKGCRVLIFEGWCLGAVPQDQAALERPVNSLEAEEDRSGHWRRHATPAWLATTSACSARSTL